MNQLKNKLYSFLLNQGLEPEYDVFDYGYKILTKYLIFLTIVIPLSIEEDGNIPSPESSGEGIFIHTGQVIFDLPSLLSYDLSAR